MILTCPECSTRFRVPTESLGDGRTVRCSRCSHRWFQAPEEDAPAPAAAESAMEDVLPADIPDDVPGAVDDVEPEDAPAAAAEDRGDDAPADVAPGGGPDRRTGAEERLVADGPPPRPARPGPRRPAPARDGGSRLATALWVMLVLVVAGTVGSAIGFRGAIMAQWPAAESLYEIVGLGAEPPGAGLGLRNVRWKATAQGDAAVLRVEGEVTNLTDTVRNVPPIEGVIYDKADRELQRWTFTAPEPRLLPGENVPFVTELKNPAAGAVRLQIVFAPRRPR
jgi:predicted Zn finger-like uncharacterized protein